MRTLLNAHRDVTKYYFTLPNSVFDLELHHIALSIYAYLLRIEDRRTYQCIASYPTIGAKLGLSITTVAKYVRQLEERGLIQTEHTDVITKDGFKRNGCLRYTILPIQNAIDLYHQRQLEKAQRSADLQHAKATAERLGAEFVSFDGKQTA